MPSVPKRPLYRGSTLKNFLDIWKAGEIKPTASGYAGGLSARLLTPKGLASKPQWDNASLNEKIGVVLYFKPELRSKLTPVEYTEEFFKKNPKLAEYVRNVNRQDFPSMGDEAFVKDTVSGATTYHREKEFVSDKPIPIKENLQKIQIYLTPEVLADFANELRGKSDKSLDFFGTALIDAHTVNLPSPHSPHRHWGEEKRMAFLATALTARIARQFKGVPLEVYYGKPDYMTKSGTFAPFLKTSGEVPKIRRKDFSIFLPKMKRAKWGIFNTKEGFSIPYGQLLTKPEAEKKAKAYAKELGKPLEVKKLSKADYRKPIYL